MLVVLVVVGGRVEVVVGTLVVGFGTRSARSSSIDPISVVAAALWRAVPSPPVQPTSDRAARIATAVAERGCRGQRMVSADVSAHIAIALR